MSDLINGQILEEARNKIKLAKEQARISKRDRIQYEILELIVIFLQEDHPKTALMFNTYKPVMWVMLIATGAIITGIATGHFSIIFVP